MREAVIYKQDELNVLAVAGKMTPLRLYSKAVVGVYRSVGPGVILDFLEGVYKFASRNYLKEIIAIYPPVY